MSNKKFPFSKLFVLHCLMYCGCTTGTYYYNATLTTIASTMDGNVILADKELNIKAVIQKGTRIV